MDRWLAEVVALQRQLRVACLADRLDQLALGAKFLAQLGWGVARLGID